MKKHFNTTGPCHPGEHYMLPAQARCEGLAGLIAQKHYFVIHAAHETGKTTLLLDLVRELNGSGDYHALYCSLGTAEGIDDPERGIPAVVRSLKLEVEFNEALEKYVFAEKADYSDFNNVLVKSLSCFCKKLDRPLVILFNDMDCLSYETRNSFLLQLRDGFVNRDQIPFVHSVGLVGMRNIRDYKFQVRDEHQSFSSASPLDIVSETFKLRDFTRDEITQLYEQHTEQSGQVFSEEAVRRIYHHTGGQPWLVNAVAREIVDGILGSDFSKEISPEHAGQAAENIIRRRDTHIDSLLERLKEKRVQKIVEPVITGERRDYDSLGDDCQYVLDLGLLRESSQGLVPSNPIYAEVIVRTLSFRSQREMDDADYPPKAPAYLKGDRLDMKKLLRDFQSFWRRNSEIWTEAYQYRAYA